MARGAVLLLLLAGLALGATACGGGSAETAATTAATTTAPAPAAGEEEGVRGSGAPTSSGPPQVGERVPDVVGTSLDGTAISLADFRGKKVIVNLWSSW